MARVGITSGYYEAAVTTDHYGSGSTAQYIPQLYSKKVLKNFYANTFYNDICNTDYEGEIKNQGDKVNIRSTPDLTVNDYTIGGTISYEVPYKADKELNIDKAKYVAFRCDDIDKVQTDIGLVNMFAEDAMEKLKVHVDTEVLDYLATGADANNFGTTAGAITGSVNLGTTAAGIQITSANATQYIVNLNLVLDEADQSPVGRFAVLPAWYCALMKLGDLKSADVTGDSSGTIRTGLVGEIDGTQIYKSNNVKHVTDTTEHYYCIAGNREAATFAMQVSKVDTLKIPDSFGEYWRTLFVYGRSVVQPTALAVLYAKQ